MPRAFCPLHKHYPEEVIAYPTILVDEENAVTSEIGIVMNGDGECTNRWEDGTMGVTDEMRESAESEDYVICAKHRCECDWHHATDPTVEEK